ncbi:type IV secretory system conjugative DNA transfer family protein [Helicobacter monodelphidis]|uniref:type IV secretory system conjugative DNA transfer family protein n=1 Tax=Helicobacter sp. 15-1451 TaxID=2004995 RepID=UPI0015EB717F|nr:DUF87 domain-containing protein [Helicobacter sp. 15-1451]
MSQDEVIEEVEQKAYRLKTDSLRTILQKNEILNTLLKILMLVGISCSVILAFKESQALFFFVINMALITIGILYGLYSSSVESHEKNESLIDNDPSKKYMICLGYEVKKFHGDAIKSSRAIGNKVRPILVNAEVMKRHLLIMATIGAGKSVLMKGMVEQLAILGGGGMIIDGKGTAEFAKDIYGLFVSIGREDDFYHINFLDMDNTHTINPLCNGNAMSLYEMLIMLLVGEENEWKDRQKEYMKNILKLLVWKRDYENIQIDFSMVAEILPLETLTLEALKYKDKAKDFIHLEDFCQFISTTIGIDYQRFLKGVGEEFEKEVKRASKNFDIQGVYNASVCVEGWRGVITNLKSDYGRIFNAPKPTISLWEATQKNKFIFITLPTMASDTTPKQIGTLLLGLIKNVAQDKAAKAVEPQIPFVCFCDELGSYIAEGYGRLESKSRSLGISMCPFFQSPAQIDAVGKTVGSESLERKEMIDVTGVHILMKNMHPETTKFYVEFVPKIKKLVKDYSKRRSFAKGAGAVEDNYKEVEEDAFKHEEVIRMSNGEMMVFASGRMYRAIAQSETSLFKKGKKTTYEGRDMSKKIPLTQFLPKNLFIQEVKTYGGKWLDEHLEKLHSQGEKQS